jgi:hypothetical protein
MLCDSLSRSINNVQLLGGEYVPGSGQTDHHRCTSPIHGSHPEDV